MYYKRYLFHEHQPQQEEVCVSAADLYTPETGYGFVIELNRDRQSNLQIGEINTGFEPYYWLKGQELTELTDCTNGVSVQEGCGLPLIFKADVPKQGNYEVTVTITAGDQEIHDLIIFAGRRRLMTKLETLSPNISLTVKSTINICDIIPRGMTERCTDRSLDLAVLADHPVLSEIAIEEVKCPTLYIAGDSTVTDQGCGYPYHPGSSYCGWGQMISYYFGSGIAISNHAHSGLTTESFRSEGHYAIIQEQIKPGDYFFIQFAHNDQKLPHLTAKGGYMENLIRYIQEIREKKANPVIVTPIARNTWKGDGSYNDLLTEFAQACILVGREYQVPVIDLHKKSMEFVMKEGVESAARYFFPKDYTHSNDFGGYRMAGYVAEGCRSIASLQAYMRFSKTEMNHIMTEWTPPAKIVQPTPPPEFVANTVNVFQVKFNDIETSPSKSAIIALTETGVISNQGESFRGTDLITRVEALDWVVKAVRFVPMNVYNDKYPDVIGHEWYAGVVETVIQNEIVNEALTSDGAFHPDQKVTAEQLVSFCMESYKCRKMIKEELPEIRISGVSAWAQEDIRIAMGIGYIQDSFEPQKLLTRDEAVIYVKQLVDIV